MSGRADPLFVNGVPRGQPGTTFLLKIGSREESPDGEQESCSGPVDRTRVAPDPGCMALTDHGVKFSHEVIDADPPCAKLGFCLTGDLTGNGRPDVIVGGRGEGYPGKRFVDAAERRNIPTFRRLRSLAGFAETNLFWYENPGFERHDVATVPYLDVGAALGDLTGDGRPNVLAGQGIGHQDVYWFEMPEDPRQPWIPHLLTDEFEKYHDLAVGDVDDDGEQEVVGLSQESETVFYYDIPDDPRRSPWPRECLHVVEAGRSLEGLAIVDVDGDGREELLAGPNIYRQDGAATGWEREPIAAGWDQTRVAVADLDRDGDLEVILSEGDSPIYGSHPGRVAWFDPPDWEPTFLADDLFCPHSLQVADFSGNGWPDVYVAEMGLDRNDSPRHFLFVNRGEAAFEQHVIATGVATHEATATDLTGNGQPDVVGKSYGPDHHVDVWYNER